MLPCLRQQASYSCLLACLRAHPKLGACPWAACLPHVILLRLQHKALQQCAVSACCPRMLIPRITSASMCSPHVQTIRLRGCWMAPRQPHTVSPRLQPTRPCARMAAATFRLSRCKSVQQAHSRQGSSGSAQGRFPPPAAPPPQCCCTRQRWLDRSAPSGASSGRTRPQRRPCYRCRRICSSTWRQLGSTAVAAWAQAHRHLACFRAHPMPPAVVTTSRLALLGCYGWPAQAETSGMPTSGGGAGCGMRRAHVAVLMPGLVQP